MTRFVIDPGIAIRIAGAEIRPAPSHRLVAPTLLRSQVLDTLYARVRNGDLAEAAALELNASFARLKIRYLGDAVLRRRAWDIAAMRGMATTGPAEYIALAQLQADALITADPDLAALAQGLIPCAPVAALTV